MRKFLSVFFLAALVAGSAMGQTVDEILAKHIAARGGIDKIKALQSMRAEASIAIQGMDIPIKLFAVDKKAFKVEMIVMDNMGYQLITTTKGWSYFPFQGQTEPQEMKPEDVVSAQPQLDLAGPLVDPKSKGITVEYSGKETIDGKPCSVLKITRSNGSKGTFYLDDKFLIVRKTETVSFNGQTTDQTISYHSYQTSPEGFVYAASWTAANGGEISISKFEANAKIDDAVFKP